MSNWEGRVCVTCLGQRKGKPKTIPCCQSVEWPVQNILCNLKYSEYFYFTNAIKRSEFN